MKRLLGSMTLARLVGAREGRTRAIEKGGKEAEFTFSDTHVFKNHEKARLPNLQRRAVS